MCGGPRVHITKPRQEGLSSRVLVSGLSMLKMSQEGYCGGPGFVGSLRFVLLKLLVYHFLSDACCSSGSSS